MVCGTLVIVSRNALGMVDLNDFGVGGGRLRDPSYTTQLRAKSTSKKDKLNKTRGLHQRSVNIIYISMHEDRTCVSCYGWYSLTFAR